MGEGLSELVREESRLRANFELAIQKIAKKVTFNQIIEEASPLDKLAEDIAGRKDYNFREGEDILFDLCSRRYRVILTPDNLRLSCDLILLKEYNGSRVERIYRKLSAEIQRVIQEHLESLPF